MLKSNNINELMKLLPEHYEQACYETKAIERGRSIKTPKELMSYCLLYLSQKYSLLELSLFAKLKGIKMSDVAFMKKLAKCNEWYKEILNSMLPSVIANYENPQGLEGYRISAVDGSAFTQQGKNKKSFRLHFMINIFNLSAEQYKITTQKTGESLTNFSIDKKQLILADRGYFSKKSIEHCIKSGGDFIIRYKHKSFLIYDSNGELLDVAEELSKLEKGKDGKKPVTIDIPAYLKSQNGELIKFRICAMKKTDDAILKSQKRIKRKEATSCNAISTETKYVNNYIVVCTSLPQSVSVEQVLETYRLRWQVEIYFKRLKTLMAFGDVPNKKEENIMAWLNGKMVVALLIEKLYSKVDFSPSDEIEEQPEHLA